MQAQKRHLWPNAGKRAKFVDGLRDIGVKIITQALRSLSDISEYLVPCRSTTCRVREGKGKGTNCVLRRQKPTLLMVPAITCSSAANRASRLSVPPSAARSLSTAASVTSSFVCDESMSEMSVASRLFCAPSQTEKGRRGGQNWCGG
jgi:hypothetical protein